MVQGLTEQWRGRRWIGTAPVDRFVRRLGLISSAALSVVAAVASRKRTIITTSLPFTRTANTCQVSRNRLHHHLPVPADRRTRRSPLPARPSPRRRRRQRADRSGSAPWRSTRTTVPMIHHRVSSLLKLFVSLVGRRGQDFHGNPENSLHYRLYVVCGAPLSER